MYAVGDIVNNKKILEISRKIYITKGHNIKCIMYKVKCLNCHNIYTTSGQQLKRNNKPTCRKCMNTYIIDGKVYHSYAEIAKDYNTTERNVCMHMNKWGELSGIGLVGKENPHYNHGGMCEVEYNGEKYESLATLGNEIGIDPRVIQYHYTKHNGDVSQVGKGKNSKYIKCAKYKIGNIVNGREIIDYTRHNDKKGQRYLYKVKCLKCGKIVKVPAKDFENHVCTCISAPKVGSSHILCEKPRKGRKFDLPKNITWSIKGNYYEVCVCAGGKNKPTSVRWREHYNTIKECQEILPDLKKLALYYKKTGNYISYGEYLKMGYLELKEINNGVKI